MSDTIMLSRRRANYNIEYRRTCGGANVCVVINDYNDSEIIYDDIIYLETPIHVTEFSSWMILIIRDE